MSSRTGRRVNDRANLRVDRAQAPNAHKHSTHMNRDLCVRRLRVRDDLQQHTHKCAVCRCRDSNRSLMRQRMAQNASRWRVCLRGFSLKPKINTDTVQVTRMHAGRLRCTRVSSASVCV